MEMLNDLVRFHALALDEDGGEEIFYYISDLHLEEQLQCGGKTVPEVRGLIKRKITELVDSVEDTDHLLLVAGDVANGFELASLFYEVLLSHWKGQIVAVLGNHELWDVYGESGRTVDEVICQYRELSEQNAGLIFLENGLLYKDRRMDEWTVLNEAEIDSVSRKDFGRMYFSGGLIFGGIGFSGMNPVCNAKSGVYREKLTRDEDNERSGRFWELHEKVRLLVGSDRVVVLSHMPPENWCRGKLCRNWIYVCGHSHRNHMDYGDNGPYILEDNQVGFEPGKWALKGFNFERYHLFDPFYEMPDGTHEITASEYVNFLDCKGIFTEGFRRPGKIYAVKKNGVYMFFLETNKLYLLKGGTGLKVGHDIRYYEENMEKYILQTEKIFAPFFAALSDLSVAVRRAGGNGMIHGCIVDVDPWNHVYLDPYTGKVSFYFAENIVDKVFFRDFMHLVNESPRLLFKETILKRLETMNGTELNLPAGNDTVICLPEIVTDTGMYTVSGKMRSIQYLIENGVIRIWKDAVLDYDFSFRSMIPEGGVTDS